MFIPRKGTPGRVLIETIYQHGPLTMERGMQLHKPFGAYLSRTREVYKRAVDSGWLTESEGTYALTPEMKAHLDSCPQQHDYNLQLTPPRMPPEFKPLSAKNMPRLSVPRPDAIPPREIFFRNGSARDEPFAVREKPAGEQVDVRTTTN